MGNPTSGSNVQTTMTLSKGKHQPSLSVGASLPLEKLGQVENPSSTENLSSAAALRPRAAEEQSITAFLGEKRMKRRTRSSQGLELHAVALEAPERRPLSSVSFGGKYQFPISVAFLFKACCKASTLKKSTIIS
jgi:hypothetical protein